jgi:hypothetical protein
MHNENVGEIDRSHNYLLNVSENRKVPNDRMWLHLIPVH